jgi:tripartite-type tricarboxylate transporter receptor subunit TctC
VGSGFHLAGELFAQMAGVQLLHVPYRGGGSAAIVDLVSGRVDLMWDNFGVVRPQVEAGKLRAIGTTGSRRIPALKDVPTIAESGLPGYDLVGWHGVLAPAGTPREIVDRMNAAINRALELPDIREQWAAQGVEVPRTTPAEFAARVKSDYQMYGRLVQSIGLKAQ